MNTYYILEVIEGGNERELISAFHFEYVVDKQEHGSSKWFISDKNVSEYLIKFSGYYPNVIFSLNWNTEDKSDHFKLYVKNGYSEMISVNTDIEKNMFPEFDKAKFISGLRENKINKII